MLMAIAADPRLRNPNHGSLLPPSWRSLYELTRLDDVTFEARIVTARSAPIWSGADIATVAKQKRREARERELGAQQRALPVQKFGVIAADPEWEFEPWSHGTGMDRAAANHYPTSCLDFIKLRDVPSIAAEDCVLFLCATPPMLPHALLVMAAWGFDYKTNYVFEKDRMITGYWARIPSRAFVDRHARPCSVPGPGHAMGFARSRADRKALRQGRCVARNDRAIFPELAQDRTQSPRPPAGRMVGVG